jgi:predicted RNase H-like nuclease (RuvC/YqgF family)
LRAECNDFDNKCHALTAENARLKEELGILKTENANKCEELAEALGEVGIDVSNTYDFTDLVQQIGCLVHEVEVEKVEIERDRLESLLKEWFDDNYEGTDLLIRTGEALEQSE